MPEPVVQIPPGRRPSYRDLPRTKQPMPMWAKGIIAALGCTGAGTGGYGYTKAADAHELAAVNAARLDEVEKVVRHTARQLEELREARAHDTALLEAIAGRMGVRP